MDVAASGGGGQGGLLFSLHVVYGMGGSAPMCVLLGPWTRWLVLRHVHPMEMA